MSILAIEGHPSDRKRLSLALRTDGHRLLERAWAEAALERMKTQWPDVIFLDLKWPGMDGLAPARRCKANPDARPTLSVAATAAPERFSRQAALAVGGEAFVVKPIDARRYPWPKADRHGGIHERAYRRRQRRGSAGG